MTSHKLDITTFLGPTGFAVEGICACGFKICQGATLNHKESVQAVQAIHDEHVIHVLEQMWARLGQGIKPYWSKPETG
jgi:hypothetical protein